MTKSETLALQRALNGSGMAYAVLGEALEEDGIFGPNTDRVHRCHLDHDTSIPTVTPEPAKPWWRSRAIIGLLTVGLAWAAGKMGWLIDEEQITQILLAILEAVGLVVAAIGTVRRKAPIDPTLVMRLPHGRDLRLPVLPNRKDRTGTGRDPGPFGF
jgi:hypothetical protein